MDIEKVEPFFENRPDITAQLKRSRSLFLDWKKINEWNEEVAQELLDRPVNVLEAFSQVASSLIDGGEEVFVHIKNVPSLSLRELGNEYSFKLIALQGIITQVSAIQLRVLKGAWSCKKCNACIDVLYDAYSEMIPPAKCFKEKGGCGKRSSFEFEHEMSEYVNCKFLTVSERPEDLPAGQIPASIPIILLGDLVNGPRAGDLVQITGIFRVRPTNKKERTFKPIIEANYIETESKEPSKIHIPPEEVEEIIRLSNDPYIFDRVVSSIAPSVYGQRRIKEGIALLLFGGVRRKKSDGTFRRGDSHQLLIGDPSTAKSVILMAIKHVAPRGTYSSGKRASAAGLTASVVKLEGMGWTLAAGALVLGDRGVCCIDEIDLMDDEDRSAIHEAMEQQTVSINKAGINATLTTRCSILASGNPTFGRYDPYKNITENIKLGPTLLSRFDLIWIMRDVPSEKDDEAMANFILRDKEEEGVIKKIPINLFKKYIAYARRLKPKIGEEGRKFLHHYWMQARKKINKDDSPIRITPRQLEALIRLTEASARIHLRKVATIEDAKRAVEIWHKSIKECGIDPETGQVDIDLIMTGKSRSVKEKIDLILDILAENGMMSQNDLIKEATEKGVDDAMRYIFDLQRDGIIFSPREGFWQKVR